VSPASPTGPTSPPKLHVFDGMKGLRRNRAIRAMYVKLFRAMQTLGLSVTPVHFYFPVPDLSRLEKNFWPGGPGESVLEFDIPAQLNRLQAWHEFAAEWNFEKAAEAYEFHINNGFFETVDAEIAYSLVRERKPRTILEVGGGNTTRLLASALRKNAEENAPGQLLTIEPEPDAVLQKGFPGSTKVIRTRVQDVPPDFFDQLEAGDILFLDSTHVVMLGSDVVYEILEILPRLKPGVLVHFHDIFTPAEYPQKFVMNNLCFWGEQYMLQAFLCGNRNYRILWSSSMMQLAYPKVLRGVFPLWQGSYKSMPESLKTFVPSFDGMNV
jgi:Methyltransferase domain